MRPERTPDKVLKTKLSKSYLSLDIGFDANDLVSEGCNGVVETDRKKTVTHKGPRHDSTPSMSLYIGLDDLVLEGCNGVVETESKKAVDLMICSAKSLTLMIWVERDAMKS